MSIYATLWTVRFPEDGDEFPGCGWITVIAQGVPAHIGSQNASGDYGSGDPFAEFLPPPVETDEHGGAEHMRAVVIVTERTKKGTPRNPQEYSNPLLVLTGESYSKMTFEALHERICDALRGDKPRLVATAILPDGRITNYFEDGTTKE